VEGRGLKCRIVCCNRDIAEPRTEFLKDRVPEFETRAHRMKE